MLKHGLAFAALLAISPIVHATAQGTLSPVIPAADKAQAAETAIGHSDRHRPFFYWLFGESSEPASAATQISGTALPAGAAAPAPATAPVMKTGADIGTK
nr:hypothetical protein [uncultured Rhodopila sp.]